MATTRRGSTRLTRTPETMPDVVRVTLSIGAREADLREWAWLNPVVASRMARDALGERLRGDGTLKSKTTTAVQHPDAPNDSHVAGHRAPENEPSRPQEPAVREPVRPAAKPSPSTPPTRPGVARTPGPPSAPKKPDAKSGKDGSLRRDLRAILEKARAAQNP